MVSDVASVPIIEGYSPSGSPTAFYSMDCWFESALVLVGFFHSWCKRNNPAGLYANAPESWS